MTKALLVKFKKQKQCGKDGMFAFLPDRQHRGFEGFRNTAGRMRNKDEIWV